MMHDVRDPRTEGTERMERCMASLVFNAGEFDEVISKTVEATVRRIRDEGPKDAARMLLTKREAAEAMSISVSTLDRLTTPRGSLRCVRLDGRVLYSVDAIRNWIEAQEGWTAR